MTLSSSTSSRRATTFSPAPEATVPGNGESREDVDRGWSIIEASQVEGRSRLSRCLSRPPLKLLQPRGSDTACSAVMSSYGGGFLQGDRIRLRVRCREDAGLFLGTQALGKVYRCPDGEATQTIEGTLEAGARAAVLPDPLVLFEESRFRQKQTWEVGRGAVLAVADGMTAGRQARGEAFAYTSYASTVTIRKAGRPVLFEPFRSEPGRVPVQGPFGFAGYGAWLALFLVGWAGEARFESAAEAIGGRLSGEASGISPGAPRFVTLARPRPDLVVVRLLARTLDDAEPLWRDLCGDAGREVVGFDPLARL